MFRDWTKTLKLAHVRQKFGNLCIVRFVMFGHIKPTTFAGDDWVNITVEWHNLPQCVKSSSDRWQKNCPQDPTLTCPVHNPRQHRD